MRKLFLLRPEPGGSASADRARAMGLQVIVAPLFRIVPLDWILPDHEQFDALLLTSANAVRRAGRKLTEIKRLPVHAVGEATAAAAREAGFEIASTGDFDIKRLLNSLEPGMKLLHLCGEHRSIVENPAQEVVAVPVYRAEALTPPVELNGLPGNVAAIHSPRAASMLAELVPRGRRGTIGLAAISAAAASAAGEGWERVAAAEIPTDSALLALAARLCEERPDDDCAAPGRAELE